MKGRGIVFTEHEPRTVPITPSDVQRLEELGASKEAVDFARQKVARTPK